MSLRLLGRMSSMNSRRSIILAPCRPIGMRTRMFATDSSSILRHSTTASQPLGTVGPRRHRLVMTVVGGMTATAAAASTYYYYYDHNNPQSSETVLGLQRQFQFWSRVLPVVGDYYWNFGSRSPYVKYQKYMDSITTANSDGSNDAEEQEKHEIEQQRRYKERLQAADERHAPEILKAILDLKGLYVNDVPGWEDFDTSIKPVLEREFGVQSLDTIFSNVDPIPCGAASIGQAHCATLAATGDKVILKVQYPNAAWQVPADIGCVGTLLQLCVWAGVVDEESSRMSYDEFSRQFLAELDYHAEQQNLQEIYNSSIAPDSPYRARGVVVPRVYNDLCTKLVITMTYLPGPKLEQEARRQLELLGIDTSKGFKSLVRDTAAMEDSDRTESFQGTMLDGNGPNGAMSSSSSWTMSASKWIGRVVGVDAILWTLRTTRRLLLLSTAGAVATIKATSPSLVPTSWQEWAEAHQFASEQAGRLALTESWIDALFDVHGHQIFNLGLFNADPHPGNILVLEEPDQSPSTRLGLIDFGQCKRLTPDEQVQVARLIVSVADNESNETIAAAFRGLGIKTKNDSTEFLADFARLMFGPLKPHHMSHGWHQKLHELDRIVYFPKELSMVYRTSILLRGLSLSLQINSSIGDKWRHHAQAAIDRHPVVKQTHTLAKRNTEQQRVKLGSAFLTTG
ncbi:ABC1 family-like protein [Fragilaria crotonensis]|nr:ABC1 family-like protein [Fragilaria crotonensis]